MAVTSNFDPVRSLAKLKRYFEGELKRFEGIFTRVGEGFTNDSRLLNTYRDRTGNLRSSVGYSIGLDGEVQTQSEKVFVAGEKGVQVGKDLGKALVDENGLVLAGYAGMEYGPAVEAKGYDVITGPSKIALRKLKLLMKRK